MMHGVLGYQILDLLHIPVHLQLTWHHPSLVYKLSPPPVFATGKGLEFPMASGRHERGGAWPL